MRPAVQLSAPAAPAGPASPPEGRKPAGRATSACGEHTARVIGSKRGRPKGARDAGYLDENSTKYIPIFVSAPVREQIEVQLFRLMGKRDPRAIPRIIKERVKVPEAAVDMVIQDLVRQYRDWRRDIIAAIAKADAGLLKRTA